jgi:hypothetical protein
LKFAIISDIHLDYDYVEGADNDCGRPLCCRSDSGQAPSKDRSAGKWGDYACDLNVNTFNSLLSHIKFLELNPFNTNKFSNNPYKGLPRDMLIYKSCYPIVYDPSNISVQCKKSSVGINMRVYRLTKEEYQTKMNHI